MIKYEINHFNPKVNHMQYNTFHKDTLEQAIECFKEKGYEVHNIRSIKKKTTENVDFKHLLECEYLWH
jgi:2C-methyl-D-erythritol 2,4-cyclodiphosphate synthase